MSHPALRLARTELKQPGRGRPALRAAAPQPEPSPEQREARRLAELAAAYGLFGLRIEVNADAAWTDAAQAYRAETAPAAAPANDARPRPQPRSGFPEIARRGAHIAPGAPSRLMQAIDWVMVIAAAEFAALWGARTGLADLPIVHATAFLLSAGALKAGLWLVGAYRVPPGRIRPEHGVGGLALGAMLGLIAAAVLAPDARSVAAIAATLPVAAMLLAGVHAAFALWIAAAHRAGVFAETVVLVGATEAARRLAARAARSGEARIVAVADDRLSRAPSRIGDAPVGGAIDDLIAWEGLPHVDRVVITVTQKAEARVRALIDRLRVIPNRVDLLLDYETLSVRGRGAERFTGTATACVSGRTRNHGHALLKRALDLALGALLLAVFALPMLVIAAAVRLDSKGPSLERQPSRGFNNRVFAMLRFRTRARAGEAARAGGARDTRIGAFLRRTRLDDLPQLFNVLRGEMSLVGPRPHAVDAAVSGRDLRGILPEYAHRHRVKPGILGWAHVNGVHGPMKSAAAVRRRVRLDLDYVARASLWFDLHILARAAHAALRRGAR